MAIDTSREAVGRLANDLRRAGHSGNFGILPVALALLAERDAALAEVARLSTPPDDAEVAELVMYLRTLVTVGTGQVTPLRRRAADAITRLSHALAAETAKREAMEEALTGLLEPFGDDPCRYDHHGKCQEHFIEDDCCVARARATLAKHGSKT